MRYRKLTPDGDYSFGSGELDFYIDVPATVGQAVQTSILLFLGEWFLNIDEGTPFMQGVFGKHTQELANSTLQNRILQVPGVVNIESFESLLNPENRLLSVTATINTIYGVTPLEIQNYVNY